MFGDIRQSVVRPSRSAFPEPKLGILRPSTTRPTSRQVPEHTSRNEPGSTKGLRAIDASLGGANIRIARRMIVTTTLKRSLAVDVPITNFDVCLHANLIATCTGKVVYVWSLDSLSIVHKFGRTTGSVHRENIRDCKFNIAGTLLATCGEDKRIVVWNLKSLRAEKVIEAHSGVVYQIAFTEDDSRLLSASDDGRIQIWQWKTGTLVGSYIRHPAAVRCFDFNYGHADRIVCGRSDGHISTWDTLSKLIIDDVKPDPDWVQDGAEMNLMAWADVDRNHTGSILCVRVSPNNRLLASGATDNTCKLWNMTSYAKDYNSVQQELQESNRVAQKMEDPIRVDDESYNVQIGTKDFTGLKIGDLPIPLGFHADLLFTFRHEGPVLAARFNNSSSILITGCVDSTCRLWSVRRGDLLFQINVPAPVTSIFVDAVDDMYCVCQNRLLFFGIKAHTKEEDLPSYWQRRSMKSLREDAVATDKQFPMEQLTTEDAQLVSQITEEMEQGGAQKKITIPELRNLISHGLILPTFLDTLLEQYKSVDTAQLAENMKNHEIASRQILRLIVNTNFHPRDILTAMASKKDADTLYNMIRSGVPITNYMLKLGYRPIDESATEESKAIFLNLHDFFPRGKALLPRGQGPTRMRTGPKGQQASFGPGEDTEEYSWSDEDEEAYLLEEEMRAEMLAARNQPKGKVLHFIPSEQIKLLKDFHANRDMKPIFLRDIVLDLNPTSGYPNFNVEAETRDTRPIIAQKAVQRQGVRFNEMSTLNRINRQAPRGQRSYGGKAFNIRDLPLQLGPGYERVRASLSSSQTVFQPAKYLRARGLNIRFHQHGQNVRGGHYQRGHVYAEPIVIRQSRSQDIRQQFVVGHSVSLREQTIDADADM
ncbi:uncharacterized protein SPPG_05795 [Spizellomyces punctatus DAOM BR117]|uniref:Uncharacterized protein n=1 Tax=Spizellomyces punctatus (strain DAOM BR117) TaxID=645134 RepID=A0A0L0HDJ4_SPIPD|nr:uncharacterized protein SPPG_05795 [Spizellomyces punctatus DAOM BR117]KNC98818.1 hypothetical protein SPPG_05795 [Spizellomyces punctatus DAOM BR117]|eukprot:XP_016606858.1 hypothetical protein SPPG_05795 [Spizellomyces punctatus DAOM BR117]